MVTYIFVCRIWEYLDEFCFWGKIGRIRWAFLSWQGLLEYEKRINIKILWEIFD
jgi:hypothetical protein